MRDAAGFAATLRDAAEEMPRPVPVDIPSTFGFDTFTASDLAGMELPEARWAVPGLLPEGLSLLAGRPKLGKSFLALNIAAAVAAGGRALGHFAASSPAEALYFGLEDNKRRLKARLASMFPDGQMPAGLSLSLSLKRMNEGGLEAVGKYLAAWPGCRLVFIDTLARIRPPRGKNGDIYQEDAAFGGGLQALALKHRVAIVLVHHLRKADSDDVFEKISGSTGLTGTADAILVLQRERGNADAVLHVTGRDVEEAEFALRFDRELCTWSCLGAAEETAMSRERAEILAVLTAAPTPLTPSQIAATLKRPLGPIKGLVWKMFRDGQVVGGLRRGTYAPASYRKERDPVNYGNPGNRGDPGDPGDSGDREGRGGNSDRG